MVSFCERHALEAKLEGQIECWGEMLFHIDLWSREARRRERTDVVELLQDQHEQATSAIERAHEELNMLRRTDTPWRAWGPRGLLGRAERCSKEVLSREALSPYLQEASSSSLESSQVFDVMWRRLIWSAPSSCSRPKALVTASLLAPIMVPRCS